MTVNLGDTGGPAQVVERVFVTRVLGFTRPRLRVRIRTQIERFICIQPREVPLPYAFQRAMGICEELRCNPGVGHEITLLPESKGHHIHGGVEHGDHSAVVHAVGGESIQGFAGVTVAAHSPDSVHDGAFVVTHHQVHIGQGAESRFENVKDFFGVLPAVEEVTGEYPADVFIAQPGFG